MKKKTTLAEHNRKYYAQLHNFLQQCIGARHSTGKQHNWGHTNHLYVIHSLVTNIGHLKVKFSLPYSLSVFCCGNNPGPYTCNVCCILLQSCTITNHLSEFKLSSFTSFIHSFTIHWVYFLACIPDNVLLYLVLHSIISLLHPAFFFSSYFLSIFFFRTHLQPFSHSEHQQLIFIILSLFFFLRLISNTYYTYKRFYERKILNVTRKQLLIQV